MKGYVALLHPPVDGSGWGVTFPDLPGCVSGGASFEAASEAAREALAGHVAMLRLERDPVPAPRSFEAMRTDTDVTDDLAQGAVAAFIRLDTVAAPKERINIMIDPVLLREADARARASGKSRSAMIEEALRERLETST